MKRFLAALLGVAIAILSSSAQEPPAVGKAEPAFREISPGVLQVRDIRLDKEARTLTFPGRLNMDKGMLEYLLVTPRGSTHESLLVSEVEPNDLHLAMLLLGAKGSGITTPAPGQAPPSQIDSEYLKTAPKLKGDEITITIRWKDQSGAEKSAPVEDLLLNSETKKPAPRGPWLYTGSMFRDEHFLAQTEGLFAAIIINPSALINNPRKGNDNDQIWEVNEKASPPADTPLDIIIKLTSAPTAP